MEYCLKTVPENPISLEFNRNAKELQMVSSIRMAMVQQRDLMESALIINHNITEHAGSAQRGSHCQKYECTYLCCIGGVRSSAGKET